MSKYLDSMVLFQQVKKYKRQKKLLSIILKHTNFKKCNICLTNLQNYANSYIDFIENRKIMC